MSELLAWFDHAKRNLPWRRTRDPYAIWVSEIMLQQTQVATVIPYFERWMARFPTVQTLAAASAEEVLAYWQGLGYYRRARMLHAGAIVLANQPLPNSAAQWRAVPGIGAYTAGAIASIAGNERAPLVDGNVKRVFARVTGFCEPDPALERAAWAWAAQNLDPERPGDHNQALMELGATVCTPLRPRCDACPWRSDCAALASGEPDKYPVVIKKPPPVLQVETVAVPAFEGKVGLVQSPVGAWWAGMWRFPVADQLESSIVYAFPLPSFKFTVTNHRVTLRADWVELAEASPALVWFEPESLESLPIPAPHRKLWNLAQSTLAK